MRSGDYLGKVEVVCVRAGGRKGRRGREGRGRRHEQWREREGLSEGRGEKEGEKEG